MDVWIRCDAANARRAWQALARFGAPLGDVTPEDLCKPDLVIQVGVAPTRIDLLTSIERAGRDGVPPGRVTPRDRARPFLGSRLGGSA